MSRGIDKRGLTLLHGAGSVLRFQVVKSPLNDGWNVCVYDDKKNPNYYVMTAREEQRTFKTLDAIYNYVKEIGYSEFNVNWR